MPITLSYNVNGDLVKIETSGVASGAPSGKKKTQTIKPRNADEVVDSTSVISNESLESI